MVNFLSRKIDVISSIHSTHYTKNQNLLFAAVITLPFIAHYRSVIYTVIYQTFEIDSQTYASPLSDYSNESLQNTERLLRKQIPIDFINEDKIFLLTQATLIL